ncbi:hypothetical protein A2767_06290 [Candidatus Roizmanbacteria bacterium RIFCSPHIGHO2_01_FULL_35_10]|uniref:Uncharacterized protein n=1 Tax=Candidatus Roizmanbacteria bacterium RIFCSPLOWO2_01_FULL_35_13 TaxID=1802055 RepID=A0A1F7IB28_9BACT|nr:MAG: hypothetical protein A2767_06290 [Candidatus Roizmanbacteria bacterium RIFCSPHIGHO2_01_FULL_35_10]OGK40564.1 MAG: hypothetical protein A3A74_00350 [Candidatus Roizmanbacteria bacterium RIFCSPLOWO2_01_FULL_35_13]
MTINPTELIDLLPLTYALGFIVFSMIEVEISKRLLYGLRRKEQLSISPIITVKSDNKQIIEIIDKTTRRVITEFHVKDLTKKKKRAYISYQGKNVARLEESNKKQNFKIKDIDLFANYSPENY